jgi:hypothetical protein
MSSIPTRIDLQRSVSSSDERIRRLELFIMRGGVEQADPSEHDPGAFAEPDPLVQWLQRGGSNSTGSPFPLTSPSQGWSVAYGPVARHLWARESGGFGSERIYRQARNLRQHVGLIPRMSMIESIALGTGAAAARILAGGPMLVGDSVQDWYYNNGRSKVYSMVLPSTAASGDRWDFMTSYITPQCGSCFGNPCEPGLACTESEFTFNFPVMYPRSEGAWVWSAFDAVRGAQNNIWVDAFLARGYNCTDPGGATWFGYTYNANCLGTAPCVGHCYCGGNGGHEIGTSYTCSQASCQFNSKYQDYSGLVACNPCVPSAREYQVEGVDAVVELGAFHTMEQQLGSIYCSGVVTNQLGSAPAYVFVVPSDLLVAEPPQDATVIDRSVVASWGYTTAPNRDAWDFTEWVYGSPGAQYVDDESFNVLSGDVGPEYQGWFQLRDRIYAELATGNYSDLIAWYAGQTAIYISGAEAGWREVPLCGNWSGTLMFRRVGGIVEWKGTIRNLQPIVGDNAWISSWLPPEAMGPTASPYQGDYFLFTWATSPNGPILLVVQPEPVYADNGTPLGTTGGLRIYTATRWTPYQTGGPVDTTFSGGGSPAWQHPRIQTYPGGPYEEISFDGVSYHGGDIPPPVLPWGNWITVPPS